MEKKKKEVIKSSEKTSFIPWNRNGVVLKRHAPLFMKSLIAGLICILLWQANVYSFSLSLKGEAENSILFISLPLASITYAFFAAYAINAVLTEYKEISRAVVKGDMETFLIYRDEQLPILMHILMGTPALFVIIFTMLFPYHNVIDGVITIFSATFLITLTFTVVIELDDCRNSIWFKEKIPKEWYAVDPIEYFRKKNQKIT